MDKKIVRVVLTGGPAAGKTTLVSRVLKEFGSADDWRVITVPETATELISGFGIKPFDNCLSMYDFQDYVVRDQLHKEDIALRAAHDVPEQNILILYDRALMDDKAYISDSEFAGVVARFGLTEEDILNKYDVVLHLVTCAKGAEFAYNLGNAARTESVEKACEMDERTLRSWSGHKRLRVIDNAVDFEEKITNGLREIYRTIGAEDPERKKDKYLIAMPDLSLITEKYGARGTEMEQTFLAITNPNYERRVRRQKAANGWMYFYNEKHFMPDGTKYDTERPISEREYRALLKEADCDYMPVNKTKYRFAAGRSVYELDLYPSSNDRAILFRYGENEDELPPEFTVLKNVTGDPAYKNRALARKRGL